MHWGAQCHAKWPRRRRGFQYSSVIEPMPPDSLQPVLTTKPLVRINYSKKRYTTRRISPPATDFLAYRTVILGFFKWNIKARHDIREFLNANLWMIHLIAFDINWSWNIFTLHNFCSMLIEQLINLKKVKTDYLKFRTDLGDSVMDGWSVTHWDKCLQRQIAQKIFKSKTEAHQVNAGHCMAFKHRISFVMDLAAKLCKLWLRLIQIHACYRFQAFVSSSLKSLCYLIRIWADALSLDRSFIYSCCFAQGSIWNLLFCSYVIFLLSRPMTDEKIEQNYGRCFGWQQHLANSIEIFISHEKKSDL